jgi:hypothetical protein
MKFKHAVERGTIPIRTAYKVGLTALRNESRRVTSGDPRRFTGSIALDKIFKTTLPTAHRWDYGIGYVTSKNKEVAIWIEVHPAETSEIVVLIKKLNWLKTFLNNPENEQLKTLTKAAATASLVPFQWIASKGVDLRPTTKQEKMLRMAGLDRPKAYLSLP